MVFVRCENCRREISHRGRWCSDRCRMRDARRRGHELVRDLVAGRAVLVPKSEASLPGGHPYESAAPTV